MAAGLMMIWTLLSAVGTAATAVYTYANYRVIAETAYDASAIQIIQLTTQSSNDLLIVLIVGAVLNSYTCAIVHNFIDV